MLRYNFDRMFKARGIERPYSFLIHSGIGTHLATRMRKNEVKHIRLEALERVCLLLRCTPNDVMEWKPDDQNDKDHPLNRLIRTESKVIDITRSLNALPMDKLEEISKFIDERVNSEE
ncbi:MAG: helix-turn-helix transcriptional regulator [Bacteroidales bacterium]|nr:helix-turn-helix transcriptional regulator [Bacteroidales bacterium]